MSEGQERRREGKKDCSRGKREDIRLKRLDKNSAWDMIVGREGEGRFQTLK